MLVLLPLSEVPHQVGGFGPLEVTADKEAQAAALVLGGRLRR